MAPIIDESEEIPLFHLHTLSQYVSVPPSALNSPLPALCAAIFSPLLLSYYPPAKGIVVAYQDVELSEESPIQKPQNSSSQRENGTQSSDEEDQGQGKPLLLKMVDEYAAPFLWATVTLLVFRPVKNAWISGRVTHQSSTHITLSFLNAFPVSILKQHLPQKWTFETGKGQGNNSGDGFWTDEDGLPVKDLLRVKIREWDSRSGSSKGKGMVRIEGTLLTREEGLSQTKTLAVTDKGAVKKTKKAKKKRRDVEEAVIISDGMEVD